MKIIKEELFSILSQLNPWWRKERIPDLPDWKRSAFNELLIWINKPPAQRAIMISGARQVGKTTLLLQSIEHLIASGIPSSNILYVTFDHPIIKLAGLEEVLEAWRELEPKASGPEYLFLDEAQFIKNFGTWVKHQVDFFKNRRIIFTGSATPLIQADQESGVGRIHALRLATLSFFEYLQIKKIVLPDLLKISHISDLFKFTDAEYHKMGEFSKALIGYFHEYLVKGGFPQTALVESITTAQRLLREDIIEKILKRDMTALFGVRRIFELEQMFIFLCMHDGGLQDLSTIAKELGVAKSTVQNFIDLLESVHLVYRLPSFGYGKEVLRARYKLYLSDAAIAPSILIKAKTILEDSKALGTCVETAIMAHLMNHSQMYQIRLSYWRNSKEKEVDFVLEREGEILPFEVKYQSQSPQSRDVLGLLDLCNQKSSVKVGYVITKNPQDSGPLECNTPGCAKSIMRIPAALFCYWLGESVLLERNIL